MHENYVQPPATRSECLSALIKLHNDIYNITGQLLSSRRKYYNEGIEGDPSWYGSARKAITAKEKNMEDIKNAMAEMEDELFNATFLDQCYKHLPEDMYNQMYDKTAEALKEAVE